MKIRERLARWLWPTEVRGPLPCGLDSMPVERPRSRQRFVTDREHPGIASAGDLDGEIR